MKAANVFIHKEEGTGRQFVKIGDLGVAKLLSNTTAFATTVTSHYEKMYIHIVCVLLTESGMHTYVLAHSPSLHPSSSSPTIPSTEQTSAAAAVH